MEDSIRGINVNGKYNKINYFKNISITTHSTNFTDYPLHKYKKCTNYLGSIKVITLLK